MVLWGLRWIRFFLNPYASDDFEFITESDRRAYILQRLENAEFSEWSWVVVVAGVGFFTDAYSIFAINMVMPMLGIIYYDGAVPHNYETALSVVTLGGSIIGQITFGLGADIWGRRKMYGLELIITIGATLGVVMASSGQEGSMSLIVWLLVWRFVLGIGIGADYPLSAVICSEFAPTRWRGKMLTAVFACQPLGQLAATLVALAAAAAQRHNIPADATAQNCNAQCVQTLDSVWRWIIGVGVIPAVIALWFRLTIIESPRYTADVGRDSRKAASELSRYLLLQAEGGVISASSFQPQNRNPESYPLRRRSVASSGMGSIADSRAATEDAEIHESRGPSPFDRRHFSNPNEPLDANGLPLPKEAVRGTQSIREIYSERSASPGQYGAAHNGAHEGEGDLEGSRLGERGEIESPPPPSWKDFKKYFWHDGNLRTLIAVSFCWFCLDLPFYGLGMNSPRIISVIWYGMGSPPIHIYPLLVHNVWQSLVVVSLGALTGMAITFVAIDKIGRRNIQLIGFFWLFILFVVIGGSFHHLIEIGGNAAIIVLYILCQIFFNFGPNTTTYIMPAELFPTRYRALCHGIAAAAGKFGSVLAQLFLAYISYGNGINYENISRWLPYSLLIFSIFMLLGLLTTLWIPASEHGPTGQVKTLEEWEVGRATPNGFSQTKVARVVESCWKVVARVWEKIYLAVDALAGGDERERREAKREAQREREEREMRDAEDAEGALHEADEPFGEAADGGESVEGNLRGVVNGHAGGHAHHV